MGIPTGNVDDKPGDSVLIVLSEKEVRQRFPMRYLTQFAKGNGLSKFVVIKMRSDMPLEIEYNLSKMGSLRYFLAPKMEDPEDEDVAMKKEIDYDAIKCEETDDELTE